MSEFEVQIWGARGSIPVYHPDHQRAGCNTTCVSVRINGHISILDAGTGIVRLGDAIGGEASQDMDLFLSHYHYDHVLGLNFFPPLRSARTHLTVHGGTAHTGEGPQAILSKLFSQPFCPNELDSHPGRLTFESFATGDRIALKGGAHLIPYRLNHPSVAYGFRIEYRNRVFVFAPDFELGDAQGDAAMADMLRDADLAVLDTMFTPAEITEYRGYGHSSWQDVARICAASRVASWRLFHHAPSLTDSALDAIEAELRREFPDSGAAREGDLYVL